jgi:hypothetical protein
MRQVQFGWIEKFGRHVLLVGVVAATVIAACPLWGKFGISKTRAVFMMYFPPAFHVPSRELRLKFISSI